MDHLLLTIILVLVAICLFAIASPIIVVFLVGAGTLISLPFLWVYEKIERKLRARRLKRDEKRAEQLGLRSSYVYRNLLKRAKEDGVSIEEYIEQNGTSIRGARW